MGYADKMQHIKILEQLTKIIEKKALPMVAKACTSRVGEA